MTPFDKGRAADPARPSGPLVGTVTVTSTHLHPGARGALPSCTTPPSGDAAVTVEFSDGVACPGRLAPMACGRSRLEVEAYRTSRGAKIGAKAWILEPAGEDATAFRVRARAD